MRIAVLAHGLRLAGGMVVGKNIVGALPRVGRDHSYLIVVPSNSGYEALCEGLPDYKIQTYQPRQRNLLSRAAYDLLALPRIVGAFKPDVVLGLASVGLLRPKAPQAIYFMTPHLCYRRAEQPSESLMTLTTFQMQAAYLRLQLRRTNLLIAQTDAIAQRLRERFPFSGEVAVSPIAISDFMSPADDNARPIPEALRPFANNFKLLYLTRYYRHKNIERIVDMFNEFGDSDMLAGCVAVLTIDGRQEPDAARIVDAISSPKLRNRIINIGPVPHEELAGLYGSCDALLMPSLFESFSSTYVEAMHYGLPIITSDLDFARSSCGEAAVYFDPGSAESMAHAIRSVATSPALAGTLRTHGRTRLSELPQSWDDIVSELLDSLVGLTSLGVQT